MITLLLADDQQLVRAGLRMLCAAAPDITVVGEAADGRAAIALAARHEPDVILMDLRMPGLDGIAATREILRARPETRIVVLTTFDDDDHLYPALAAGAIGFLAKDVAPEELLGAIRRAATGESPFSPAVLRRLVDTAVRQRAEPRPPLEITDRERDVLALLAAGLSNADIGDRLHLGVTTVKTHVASLLTKTACNNRVQLAVLAAQHGLIAGPDVAN
ncbi:MAG TPA: response regulator transcription factor [Pseudonocardiaceae bacterium]|nr:response regulator transcription factor [Pseudonocardiaceae bacterium]